MRKLIPVFLLGFILSAASVQAADKTYQVTGPVMEVDDHHVVVQKGKDLWELKKDGSTKVTGDLKKGEKVTIDYTMTAKSIEVKAPAAAATKKK